jgi:hypothetical protein
MTCVYDQSHPGFEIVYLLGRFGTRAKGAEVGISTFPPYLKLGNWTRQGLTFYSGSVAYCRRIQAKLGRRERLFVRVPDFDGVAVRVMVDDKEAGIAAWPPYEVDISALLPETPFELRLEVLGHRRNSHGPLHLPERYPAWTGPGQFVTTGEKWTDDYYLVPCGMNAEPELVVKR